MMASYTETMLRTEIAAAFSTRERARAAVIDPREVAEEICRAHATGLRPYADERARAFWYGVAYELVLDRATHYLHEREIPEAVRGLDLAVPIEMLTEAERIDRQARCEAAATELRRHADELRTLAGRPADVRAAVLQAREDE